MSDHFKPNRVVIWPAVVIVGAFLAACPIRFLSNVDREDAGDVQPREPEGAPSVSPEASPEPGPQLEPEADGGRVEPDPAPGDEPEPAPTPSPTPEGPDPSPDAGVDGGPLLSPDAGFDSGPTSPDGGVDGGIAPQDAGVQDAGGDPDGGAGEVDAGFDAGPICGNDIPEQGEECDDGNTEDRDGCSQNCRAWWDEGWPFRATITINNVADPNDVYTNAPVLLRIDPVTSAELGLNQGRFCFVGNDDETVFAANVERLAADSLDGDSIFWIRVPSVPVGVSTFQLYAGGDACPLDEAGNVFSSRYAAVWHMNDDNWSDATGRGQSLSDLGAPAAGGGRIGNGVQTNVDNYLIRDNVENEIGFSGDVTVEAWMQLDDYGPGGVDYENTLIQVAGTAFTNIPYFLNLENAGWVGAYWSAPNEYYDYFRSVSDVGVGWNHAAWTRNTSTRQVNFYFNGSLIASRTYAATQDLLVQSLPLRLSVGGNRFFSTYAVRGAVDEVRIANRPHGAAWIKFQHEQVADDTVVVFGTPEILPNL